MNKDAIEIAERLAGQLLEQVGDKRTGLPAPIFRLVSQLTPMVNVDLLIRDEQGRTLLTWRADEFYGPGWHIPGGIIRFKENIATRISKVAETELGCLVTHQAQPVAMHEIMAPNRDVRGHFISFLYVCSLKTPPRADLQAQASPPQNGEWKWHTTCPDDLISAHERFRPYIARSMPAAL